MFIVGCWALAGFLLGSIPFSYLLGQWFAKRDIRSVGDGNPGGTNALKAGGLKIGIPAILLDISKGFFPVYFAQRYGLYGWALVPVCLAPILGHSFSPFLRFKGGKALGATGGVWLALVGLWVFPVYGALALPATLIQKEDAWSACLGMMALFVYAVLRGDSWLIGFTVMNALIIIWNHRYSLRQAPVLRPRLSEWLSRRIV